MGRLQARIAGFAVALEGLCLDPVDIDLDVVGDPAVLQRLDQGFVGVLQDRVFADHRHRDLAVGVQPAPGDFLPHRQVGFRRIGDAEMGQHLGVQSFAVIVQRHGVDVGGVHRLDHAGRAHIAEQADLALLLGRDREFAPAQQDIGLDADRPQLLDRVLGRLGLHLAGGLDERQQGQVHEARLAARQVLAQLADGLKERKTLDVADRAADLDQHEIRILTFVGQGRRQTEGFDLVGHVRDHLHGRPQIVAAPLLLEDGRIDAAGRDVVGPGGGHACEPLIVTEVEVSLGPVIRHKDLTVLVRTHRARIDVEIRVQLPQPDLVTTRLQKRAESGGGEAFSKGGNHAAGDEHVTGHGGSLYR